LEVGASAEERLAYFPHAFCDARFRSEFIHHLLLSCAADWRPFFRRAWSFSSVSKCRSPFCFLGSWVWDKRSHEAPPSNLTHHGHFVVVFPHGFPFFLSFIFFRPSLHLATLRVSPAFPLRVEKEKNVTKKTEAGGEGGCMARAKKNTTPQPLEKCQSTCRSAEHSGAPEFELCLAAIGKII
jgi:hypothetical protein